jgi:hypothetical protein
MKMQRPFASGLQLMFTPEALIPFLIGTLALAVLGNAVYQLLTNYLGTCNMAVVKIGVGAVVTVVGMAWVLSRFVNRLRPSPPLLGKQPPEKRKGLILLVSNEATSREAIEWHQNALEYCWLLCSTQSASIAEKLRQELTRQGKTVKVDLINDIFDPLEYRDKVEAIYAEMPDGWAESDVILDFTGMTACASVGSVLACLNEQRAIQYTPGQYDTALKAMQPLDPVEVVLHWGVLSVPSAPSSPSLSPKESPHGPH